jgi:hypothetical protein
VQFKKLHGLAALLPAKWRAGWDCSAPLLWSHLSLTGASVLSAFTTFTGWLVCIICYCVHCLCHPGLRLYVTVTKALKVHASRRVAQGTVSFLQPPLLSCCNIWVCLSVVRVPAWVLGLLRLALLPHSRNAVAPTTKLHWRGRTVL